MIGHRAYTLRPTFTVRTHKAPHPRGHRQWLRVSGRRAERQDNEDWLGPKDARAAADKPQRPNSVAQPSSGAH